MKFSTRLKSHVMIFQTLIAATAAGLTITAVDAAPSTPKRADYYTFSPAFTGSGIGGAINTPGSAYTTFLNDVNEGGFFRVNAAGSPIGYLFNTKTGIYSSYSVVSRTALADYSVPMQAPPTLFLGMHSSLNAGVVRIHKGIKRTSYSAWSQVQVLSPPESYSAHSYYAQSMVADQGTHSLLAVGCHECNATTNGGQVYLYSPHDGGSAWSQSQVLQLSASATHAGYHRMGRDVQVYDNVLLASVYVPNSIPKTGYVVFSRGHGPKDSFEPQQILTTRYGNVTAAAVYEETIVLANDQTSFGANSYVGEVQILYPSTPEFGLKPAAKPHPVQWSVQQILRPPTQSDDLLFGASVSIDRDLLIVSALGDGDLNVLYRREERGGKWSQQQVLTGGTSVDWASIAGGAIALGATKLVGGRQPVFYSNQDNWDCLIISLEDQFGDGWDTAELIVATPDGKHEYFAQGCDTANPLRLRYCPTTRSAGGLYSFSVPEAIKAKHHWEIQWSIFDQNTALWYRGKWDSKMDFHWDPDTLTFSPRKMERLLANHTVCEYCPSRPTEKPTPVLHRNLKGGDDATHTRSPTVSPAPTLATTNILNWRYLTLHGDSFPWFDNQYQGTNYYVSDAHAHRLIGTGTACTSGIDQQCWLDLPDGDYILRLGGGLDPHKSSHKFTFCKTVNEKNVQSQMMFRIKDDDCSVITYASKSSVCRSLGYAGVASVSIVLNVNMLLHGTSISSTTSAEHTVFQDAVASVFKGLTPSDVTLVSVAPTGTNTVVNANIRMSSAVGYDLLDYDQEASFEAFLKDSFSSRELEGNMVIGLASGSVASAFAQVTRVEFLNFELVDSVETFDQETEADMVTSYADLPTADYTEPMTASETALTSSLLVDSLSLGGYFLAFVGILFAVALSRKKAAPTDDIAAPAPSEAHLMESALHSEVSSKRSKKIGTPKKLSLSDLQELARMEQEYLKLATNDVPS
jgi:hypothetical protein